MSNTSTPAAVRDRDGMAVIGETLHSLRGIRFDEGEGGNAGTGEQRPADPTQADVDAAAAAAAAASQAVQDAESGAQGADAENGAQNADEAALGDPGKRALDSMKKAKREAEEKARDLQRQLDEAIAKANGREAEHQAQVESQRIKDEAIAGANKRIVRSEVKAAAAGKVVNVDLALRLLDLDAIDVDENGDVDSAQITSRIDELVREHPYLAAQGSARFQGDADQGARTDTGKPLQITEEQLRTMSPEAVNQARIEGRLDTLLGVRAR